MRYKTFGLLLMLIAGGCQMVVTAESIVGGWLRADFGDCQNSYPRQLMFQNNGVYSIVADDNQVVHSLWDGGEFFVEDGLLKIQMANDAMENYRIKIEDGKLEIYAQDCLLQYRKL